MLCPNDNFLDRLINYKNLYLNYFDNLTKVSCCDCKYLNMYRENRYFAKFCDDMYLDFKTKKGYIKSLFDILIEVFGNYKKILINDTYINLKKYYNQCSNYSSYNAIQLCNVLFRGSIKGKYDSSDIKEFFHIPFSSAESISSQRFSIKGKPMLYLSKSIATVTRELNEEASDIDYAIYYPIYSYFYKQGASCMI